MQDSKETTIMPAAPGRTRSRRRIMIVDDHPILRAGLTRLLEQEGDLMVSAQASTAEAALAALAAHPPDAVIVDIALPDGSGLDLIRQLTARAPALPVLVLSVHDEAGYAERAFRAGARGYVAKSEPPETILEGLRQVLAGRPYASAALAIRLAGRRAGLGANPQTRVDNFTERELEIFELQRGLPTRQIAQRLKLSVKTIETHRGNLKRKLGIRHASELLRSAIEWNSFDRH